MNLAIPLLVTLALCPVSGWLGRELSIQKTRVQAAAPVLGAQEKTGQSGPGKAEQEKWNFSDAVSPSDGSRTVTMSLAAEPEGPAVGTAGSPPSLYVRCQSHQTDVYLRTGSIPVGTDANLPFTVQVRWDGKQPIPQEWDQSISHDSLFAPHPVEFAQKLAFAKELSLEFTPPGSGPVVTRFDLSGLNEGLTKLANACGWSLQSPAEAAAKAKASLPTLHSIRKVYLESDWADDDDAIARKAGTISKHTCLQVVATPAAADAILVWSIQGFTGGTLELRTKEGQLIWSRSGNLRTPLKVLDEAVGCSK